MHRKNKKEKRPVKGTIRIHPRGFGFVIPEDKKQFPEDIFIPKHATKGAVDGDTVEVEVNPIVSEKGPEGMVLHIVKRGRSQLAGTVTYVGKNHQIYAYVPLLGEDQAMLVLPPKKKKLKVGDRIIIQVLEWGGKRRECLGEMSAYIGHISDPLCDIEAAIYEYEIKKDFPEQALIEAKGYGTQTTPKDWHNREDLRSLDCFTIDPDTAKDFDDALSLTCDASGNYHLGVHIADVSYYVKEGTALDQEAAARCNSVYFPGTVVPMLPHELSSHLCSLKPNVNRLTISVLATLDSEGTVKEYRIVRSVIKSKKRFTYKEAKALLDGEKKGRFTEELKLMEKLCYLLKKKRYQRGSIEFALPDLSLELRADGQVKKLELVEYDISHQLVEEFMLLANEIVATHLSLQGKPLTYRIHEEPNPETIKEFSLTASALGFKIPPTPTAEELQKMFDEARESPFGQFLATAFIRSMKLASYSTQNVGHYGLGLEHYTHFTSPIRRYIDLLVHRVLFDEVAENVDLEELALKCSEKERLSSKAESSVILLKKLRYLQQLKNQQEDLFQAVIVAIKPFGVIFELKEFLYEGFLPLTHHGFVLGNEVKVRLTEVDLVTKQTDWELLSALPAPHKKSDQRRKRTKPRRFKPKAKKKR